MSANPGTVNIASVVPTLYRERLLERARAHDRSLSSEIRVAIRRYLEATDSPDASALDTTIYRTQRDERGYSMPIRGGQAA